MNERIKNKLVSSLKFIGVKLISDNPQMFEMSNNKTDMNKSIYICQSILDLSKNIVTRVSYMIRYMNCYGTKTTFNVTRDRSFLFLFLFSFV